MYNNINLHHDTLDNCLNNGKLYLNRFLFSLDLISEFSFESILNSDDLISLIEKTRQNYTPNQPRSKSILAQNMVNVELSQTFSSIGELSRHLKGDRQTIRNYIHGNKEGLYRNQ